MEDTANDQMAQAVQVVQGLLEKKMLEEFPGNLQSQAFTDRADCREYCVQVFGKDLMRELRNNPTFTPSADRLSLTCRGEGCQFMATMTRKAGIFQVRARDTVLSHGGVTNGETVICNSQYCLRPREIISTSVFMHHKNNEATQPAKKRKRTQKMLGAQIAVEKGKGCAVPSAGAIAKANSLWKQHSRSHLDSYRKLEPYLQLCQEKDPKLKFHIEKTNTNEFVGMAVLLPYTMQALPNCFSVVGFDAAHMGTASLKGVTPAEMLALCHKHVAPGQKVDHEMLYVTMLSGRTLDNEMILFAYSLTYGETTHGLLHLCKFLRDEGVPLNDRKMTILTDRAGAYILPLETYFPNALHHLCPLHLKRNLVNNASKHPDIVSLYWKLQRAATHAEYQKYMQRLKAHPKGADAALYLEKVEGVWQTYKAVERGNIMLNIKSDNLVEGAFAWLLDVRELSSAYFFTRALFLKIAQRVADLAKAHARYALPKASSLTTFAQARLQEIWPPDNHVYSIIITRDKGDGLVAGIVSRTYSGSYTTSYNVDFQTKTCDCKMWVQTGVPCRHAAACLKYHRPRPLATRSSQFYEWCTTARLIACLKDVEMKVAPDVEVQALANSDPARYALHPCVKVGSTAGKSNTRIASQGDGPAGGGRSLKQVAKSQLRACPSCTKMISGNTRHGLSACKRHQKQKPDGYDRTIIDDYYVAAVPCADSEGDANAAAVPCADSEGDASSSDEDSGDDVDVGSDGSDDSSSDGVDTDV